MRQETKQDRNHSKKRFWQAHIRAWNKSGLSQNEYCNRNTLKPSQFCYWKKSLRIDPVAPVAKFFPIPVQSLEAVDCPRSTDSGLTISFDKITIKLRNDFDATALSKAVAVLGGKP